MRAIFIGKFSLAQVRRRHFVFNVNTVIE